ncbi:MAG: FkbM family methyltransferase [Niveispirillum sp.]|uniref:FkbM family methyltransferase n=1 Tax=Niveispirillum sp. TaxID=1917217 RepID=UPI0040351BDB
MAVASQGTHDLLADAIASLTLWKSSPFFVQISGCTPVPNDPLHSHIARRGLSGLIIEPVFARYQQLVQQSQEMPLVKAVHASISGIDGQRPLWFFNAEAFSRGILPPHLATVITFAQESLLADISVLGRATAEETARDLLASLLDQTMVRAVRLDTLFREQGVRQVDILRFDSDGYGLDILNAFDFKRARPAVIHYRHEGLSLADRRTAAELLMAQGYRVAIQGEDTIALRDGQAIVSAQTPSLLVMATRLLAEGRTADALNMADHLVMLNPEQAEPLALRARCHQSLGNLVEALEDFIRVRDLTGSLTDHLPFVSAVLDQVLPRVATLFSECGFEELARYVVPVTTLLPDHAPFLEVATRTMVLLNRETEATRCAQLLLPLRPDNELCLHLLTTKSRNERDWPTFRRLVTALARKANSIVEPQVRQLLILELLNLLICPGRPEPEDQRLVDEMTGITSQLAASHVPDGNAEKDAWVAHFDAVSRGIRLAEELGPVPTGTAVAPARLMTARGLPITPAGLQAKAKELSAQTVLLVAADERYFRRYARLFVLSALRNLDVPALIIVHVIGGAARMRELVDVIGIDDDRLILTGDDFDPSQVTTTCIADPQTPIPNLPVAHFQSVRFEQADYLLHALNLPVFVADIDCLLLRGVGDLLHRMQGTDVVFNCNDFARMVCSLLTANLLLIAPTETGRAFSGFLRQYLSLALSRPTVSRWIDQIGLLLVRNHVQTVVPTASIDYFATESDINNIVYRQLISPDRYRFFALYQKFYLPSLAPLIRSWEQDLSLSPSTLPWGWE